MDVHWNIWSLLILKLLCEDILCDNYAWGETERSLKMNFLGVFTPQVFFVLLVDDRSEGFKACLVSFWK